MPALTGRKLPVKDRKRAYEPFGIAPLEPFSSGAVCALSDASGCAAHLDALYRRDLISCDGFLIGNFSRIPVDPRDVDLRRLRAIERAAYDEMVVQLARKLAIPRSERIRSAQSAMAHLSWSVAVQQLLNDALANGGTNQIGALCPPSGP